MKDLTSKDIFPRKSSPLKLFSAYVNGIWSFALPTSTPVEKNNQYIYKIDFVFGLCKEGEIDPSQVKMKGKKGDYLGVSINGVLNLITQAQYKLLFPPINTSEKKSVPLSSKILKEDKNFLTNIFKGIKSADSNTVVITPVPTTLPTSTGTTY